MLTWTQLAEKVKAAEATDPSVALRISVQRDKVVVMGLGRGDLQAMHFLTFLEAENEVAIDAAIAKVLEHLR